MTPNFPEARKRGISHRDPFRVVDALQGEALSDCGGEIHAHFLFDDTFIGFRGHFPGEPILPAFIQMMMAKVLVEALNHCPLQVVSVKNAKFLLPIHPGQEIEIKCLCQSTGAEQSWAVRLTLQEGLAATFVIVLGQEETTDEKTVFFLPSRRS